MLTGSDRLWYEPAYALIILGVLVFGSYRTIVRIFKWLTLVLFAYVIAAFLAQPDWRAVAARDLRAAGRVLDGRSS